ncbi:hypothetical protein BaRGS_00001875 [Batillaria attramentaria]|uniref:Secreted protein n=1 Tax=Batillaria attramentaria TaxID=370345 RepID=A0ABD0M6I0_9CAEN
MLLVRGDNVWLLTSLVLMLEQASTVLSSLGHRNGSTVDLACGRLDASEIRGAEAAGRMIDSGREACAICAGARDDQRVVASQYLHESSPGGL